MHFDPQSRLHQHSALHPNTTLTRRSLGRWFPTPRVRLLLALAAVLLVSMTPPTFAAPLAAVPCSVVSIIVALAVAAAAIAVRISPKYLGTRLAIFAPLLALIAASIPLSHGLQTGWFGMGAVWIKGLVSFAAMLVLAWTTSAEELLRALRQLHVPALFVATLSFMNRYLYVASEELVRMRRARAARTFEHAPAAPLRTTAGLIGMLLVRSFERSERVHAAMLARGFDGEFRSLD
jgi:cobalt/nickel transport system permease protein